MVGGFQILSVLKNPTSIFIILVCPQLSPALSVMWAPSPAWLFTLVLEEGLSILFLTISEQQQLLMGPMEIPTLFIHLRGFHHNRQQMGLLREILNRDSKEVGPNWRVSQLPDTGWGSIT